MSIPTVNLHNDWEPLDGEAVLAQLKGSDRVAIDIALPSLGSSNSYVDIYDDLRDASYVCEYLSNRFDCSRAERIYEQGSNRVRIEIRSFDPQDLLATLIDVQWTVKPCVGHQDQSAYDRHREAVEDFEENIHRTHLNNPHIADDFLANKVGGAYFDIPEALAHDAEKNPERRLGFWKSPYFYPSVGRAYNSLHSTIVPKEIEIEDALSRLGGPSEIYLLHAEMQIDSNTARFLSEGFILSTPATCVHSSLCCSWYLDEDVDPFEQRVISAQASEFKDFAVLETSEHWIVLHEMKETSPQAYAKGLYNIADRITGETFIDDSFEIDWAKVDDEVFEEICYDYIYQSSTFDRGTIFKMGKSRSRDGGRDITVNTYATSTDRPKKFIFQCKALAVGRSLTTSNLGPVSDVIEQYAADGYGVFTTGVMDATVHDRLTAITGRREIELRTISRLEIERFLARRPVLLAKYRQRVALGR